MRTQPGAHRNERLRRFALKSVVWIVLVVFILTSVGVALVGFAR